MYLEFRNYLQIFLKKRDLSLFQFCLNSNYGLTVWGQLPPPLLTLCSMSQVLYGYLLFIHQICVEYPLNAESGQDYIVVTEHWWPGIGMLSPGDLVDVTFSHLPWQSIGALIFSDLILQFCLHFLSSLLLSFIGSDQVSVNFFQKGPVHKYFRLWGLVVSAMVQRLGRTFLLSGGGRLIVGHGRLPCVLGCLVVAQGDFSLGHTGPLGAAALACLGVACVAPFPHKFLKKGQKENPCLSVLMARGSDYCQTLHVSCRNDTWFLLCFWQTAQPYWCLPTLGVNCMQGSHPHLVFCWEIRRHRDDIGGCRKERGSLSWPPSMWVFLHLTFLVQFIPSTQVVFAKYRI